MKTIVNDNYDIESVQSIPHVIEVANINTNNITNTNRICYIFKLISILICISIILVFIIVAGFLIYAAETGGFDYDAEYYHP